MGTDDYKTDRGCCAVGCKPVSKLFVIKQRHRELYWCCSSEHGSGWNPGNPKQSFSPSELTRELRRFIDDGIWTDVEVLQLDLP